jgi:CheY-like chemotaxis protein
MERPATIMGKYRILIVDDDEDARRILSMALRPQYETVEANDGLDALARLDASEPDVAIIDVMMPIMDGYQLCEAIRRHPSYGKMPVMFLSAYGSKENAKKSYESGGNLFMIKPLAPDRVLKNVDLTIEQARPEIRVKRHTIEWLALASTDDLAKLAKPAEAKGEASPAPHPPARAVLGGSRDGRPQAVPPAPASAPRERPASPLPLPAQAVVGARPRILVVDDDPETRVMVDLAIRDQFEVAKASNGMEAIERLVDCEPDLMLVDIMMPKMNGYQLLQSIRRNPLFREMPVVVLSAKSSPRDRDYAAKLGATAYLAKPYQVEELLQALRVITAATGFRVRPKSRSIEQIRRERVLDEKAETDDLLRLGKDIRQAEAPREPVRYETDDPFGGLRA